MSTPIAIQRTATRFMAVYTVASLPLVLKLLKRGKYTSIVKFNKGSAKLALVPAALSPLFSVVKNLLEKSNLLSSIVSRDKRKQTATRIAAALCSPIILLLPSSLRIYIAIYALTGALRAFMQGSSVGKGEGKEGEVEGWRRYVPPIWMLAFGNVIMLPLWLFGPEGSFPKAYDNVIVHFSKAYYTPKPTPSAPFGIKHLLTHTDFPPTSSLSASSHVFRVCETLHPLEPSCSWTFVKALVSESLEAMKMVSAVELIGVILRKRTALFNLQILPETMLKALYGIVGGCLYVGGGINAGWASICLLQRIIPPSRMVHSRFVLSGLAGVPWILCVPAARRAELSMYMFRMTLFNLSSVYQQIYGVRHLRRTEILTFAACWVALLTLRDNGYPLEKFTARMLRLIES